MPKNLTCKKCNAPFAYINANGQTILYPRKAPYCQCLGVRPVKEAYAYDPLKQRVGGA